MYECQVMLTCLPKNSSAFVTIIFKHAIRAVLLILVFSYSVSSSAGQGTANNQSALLSGLETYTKQSLLERDWDLLHGELSDTAKNDLDDLLHNFGAVKVRQATVLFPENALQDIVEAHGEDFFIVMLHNLLGVYDYLVLLESVFHFSPQKFARSVIHAKARFNGALIIFDNIDYEQFSSIIRVISEVLPASVFKEAFYRDPYLVASALRILAQRDPEGNRLKEFFTLFSEQSTLVKLFSEDLPGLVVAFSTIEEIQFNTKSHWAKEALGVTDEHLARLLVQQPENLAYILYGAHSIGVDHFKEIIREIGNERFRIALDKYPDWLADFFTGMSKISLFSSGVDFEEVNKAKAIIQARYPYLLEYNTYLKPVRLQVAELFSRLPAANEFLRSEERTMQTRVYLLGLLSLYQQILHDRMPELMITPLQFGLLKQQILFSTRFSVHLNNMISNYEVGCLMVEENSMETFILLLAHELAHQLYSISGFDAPLLSANSIHECCADIGARCIGQRLGLKAGMMEYGNKYVQQDDFSKNDRVREADLIGQGVSHVIGRTQLGYIVQGLQNSKVPVDWESLFTVNLAVLRDKRKMKNISYVQHVVGAYIYYTHAGTVVYEQLQRFSKAHEGTCSAATDMQALQVAGVAAVEEMVLIARTLLAEDLQNQ